MALLHGPDADHDLPPDPERPGDLPDGPDPPLDGGDVVDHGDGQHGVQAVVAEWKAQVITIKDLKHNVMGC